MRFIKRLLLSLLFLTIAICALVLEFTIRTGAFRNLEPHGSDGCVAMALPGSAEDIQIDRERAFAYLSVLDRRALAGDDTLGGEILRIDLDAEPLSLSAALIDLPGQFRPHGLSLFVGNDGTRYLHVINHPVDRESQPEAIEIFAETTPGAFSHLRTVRDPLLNRPNDLVAVGPEQFYVANDSGADTAWQRAGEILYGAGLATVVYFDGSSVSRVAENVTTASGINVSTGGDKIYVSETSAGRLAVFDRDVVAGRLTRIAEIDLGSAPDNIDVAADGSLHVAAHANVVGLIRSFADPGAVAPTQIFSIAAADPRQAVVDEILLDRGTLLSAGSVGASWQGGLLVGSIMDKKILVCRSD